MKKKNHKYLFVKKDSDSCYSTNWLWIPRNSVSEDEVIRECTYTGHAGKHGKPILVKQYSCTPEHWIVPRHALPRHERPQNELPFEHFEFEDRVTTFLDDKQKEAWEIFSGRADGVLNLACGRGKTTLFCKKMAQMSVPTLVILYGITTMKQWEDEIRDKLGYTGRIGRIQNSRCDWKHPITLASIRTLANRYDKLPEEVFRYFGLICFDECHHASAEVLKKVLPMFWGHRIGLTATINRSDGLEGIVFGHIGPVIHSDLWQPITPKVYFLSTLCKVAMDSARILDWSGEVNVMKLMGVLSKMQIRNEAICTEVIKASEVGRKILILTHIKKHPHILRDLLPMHVGVITGDTPANSRKSILSSQQVIIATMGVAAEALDEPDLDTVLFVTPFKSWNALQQGMGRALRKKEDKKDTIILILEDMHIPICRALCNKLKVQLTDNGYTFEEV